MGQFKYLNNPPQYYVFIKPKILEKIGDDDVDCSKNEEVKKYLDGIYSEHRKDIKLRAISNMKKKLKWYKNQSANATYSSFIFYILFVQQSCSS